jgi:hypothetical protein
LYIYIQSLYLCQGIDIYNVPTEGVSTIWIALKNKLPENVRHISEPDCFLLWQESNSATGYMILSLSININRIRNSNSILGGGAFRYFT